MTDDRAEFTSHQEAVGRAIGADADLQARSRDMVGAAHAKSFTHVWRWLGVPIIQMPTDVLVLQEIVWDTKPDVVIETGIARGGSMIFFASILELMGHGRVIGVEIDIRPHNRASIEDHQLAHRIDLVEGSSVDADTLDRVRELVGDAARVLVVLDSNHTHEHVAAELEVYAPFVTAGMHLVVADTCVEHLPPEARVDRPWGPGNSPSSALDAFLAANPAFERDATYGDKLLVTSSPGGYVRRIG